MPFMLVGARQTGKTYILNVICKNNFTNYIYIILDKEEILKNVNILAEDTVIFFDEIQVSERAITSLKYFCESEKPYKIISACSLLGVKINRFKSSFQLVK